MRESENTLMEYKKTSSPVEDGSGSVGIHWELEEDEESKNI